MDRKKQIIEKSVFSNLSDKEFEIISDHEMIGKSVLFKTYMANPEYLRGKIIIAFNRIEEKDKVLFGIVPTDDYEGRQEIVRTTNEIKTNE